MSLLCILLRDPQDSQIVHVEHCQAAIHSASVQQTILVGFEQALLQLDIAMAIQKACYEEVKTSP